MEFSYNHTTLTVPKSQTIVLLLCSIDPNHSYGGTHPPPPGFEGWAPNEWYLTWKFGGHSRSLGVFSSQGFSKLVGGSSTTPPNFKAMIILESNKKVARKERKARLHRRNKREVQIASELAQLGAVFLPQLKSNGSDFGWWIVHL